MSVEPSTNPTDPDSPAREPVRPASADDDSPRPATQDVFIRGLSEAIGGPRGEHATRPGARPGRFWTATRIILALCCLTLALHWVQKTPCRDGNWQENVQYTRFCYTDVLALYYAEGLNEGKVPYRDHPVEYPVVTGYFMGAIGLPVHALGENNPSINQGTWFYDLNVLVLGALAVATCGVILALRRRRPWDAAIFAVSPVLFITATVNWDMLAIGLGLFGMYAWARQKPVLAGVLLGLGGAAKLWPLFVLGPLFVLALRSRRTQEWALAFVSALVAWVAVNAPVFFLYRESWNRFFDLNSERPIDWGTLWYIGRWLDGRWNSGAPGDQGPFQWLSDNVPTLNVVYQGLFLVCCLGIGLLCLLAPRRPRLAQVTFLVVAVFLLSSKVWSQQFALWLLPLIVLARPRWGAIIAWSVAEFAYFTAFYAELLGAGGKPVIPEGTFVLASTLRFGTVALLVGLVVREIWRPELDVVRQTYGDDPDGGVLNGAADAPWVARLARLGRSSTPPTPTPADADAPAPASSSPPPG